MSDDTRSSGFQGAEHSSAEVTFYSLGAEPGFEKPKDRFADLPVGKLELLGRGAKGGDELAGLPTLIGVDTQKAVAGSAGTFTITVKAPKSYDFGKWVVDDDWVDIVMTDHDRKFHVMRGLVDSVRRDTSISSGATTQQWKVTGRDHQKVWEDSQVFFNRFASENVVGGATMEMFLSQEGPGVALDVVSGAAKHSAYTAPEIGNVPVLLISILTGFLRKFTEFGRATWELPSALPIKKATPALEGAASFVDNVSFDISGFTGEPRRFAYKPMFNSYAGQTESKIWALAQEWSDPQFCECFTELLVETNGTLGFPAPGEETGVDLSQSRMAVVIRDRPFPTKEAPYNSYDASRWFELPLFEVNRQDIEGDDVGRGGLERANVFMFQPILTQETAGASVQVAQPLWQTASVRRHGVRKMDVESKYTAFGDANADILNLTASQRLRMRDWFMLNHLYYNGTVSLPNGRPDIKVGTRFRIRGELDPSADETYYVETVGHSWRVKSGVRTTLGVTRGWIGDEPSYLKALADEEKLYAVGTPATPTLATGGPAADGVIA